MALQPPSQPDQWTFRRVMWATLVLVFVAISFWLLYRFNQVVFILFVAIVIGTAIRPAVAWLNRRGLPQVAGVILVYFLLLIVIIGFALLLFRTLIVERVQRLLPQFRVTTTTCAKGWSIIPIN